MNDVAETDPQCFCPLDQAHSQMRISKGTYCGHAFLTSIKPTQVTQYWPVINDLTGVPVFRIDDISNYLIIAPGIYASIAYIEYVAGTTPGPNQHNSFSH